ncbi:MAG: VWA domain-containing protein [Spirochaetales bacterium]|nr:VWA domain-containing protein [Spirochaetales bacterium]
MKKIGIIIFLLLNLCFLWSENIDVIVMVDTSWSLWQPFDDIVNYLINSMVDEIVHKGDTFHLLQFSTKTKVEITEQITDGDTRVLIKTKVQQLKAPLRIGKYTDLLGAIHFLYDFTDARPADSEKLIVLITDGIHDPPPGSKYALDYEQLKQEFIAKAKQIKNKGWNIHILRIPLIDPETGEVITDGLDERAKLLDEMARELGITIQQYSPDGNKDLLATTTGFPQIIFPQDLGKKPGRFEIPFLIKNNKTEEIKVKLIRIEYKGENILNTASIEKQVSSQSTANLNTPVKLPSDLEQGPQRLPITLIFEGDTRIISSKGELIFTYAKETGLEFRELLFYYLLPALGIAIVIVLILLVVTSLRKKSHEEKFAAVVTDTQAPVATVVREPKKMKPGDKKISQAYADVSFPIEMIVELQKRHIGFRNIHKIHRNKCLSVGGGHSSFLIFLVPVPSRIAEISFDGRTFTFTPLKKEYFPHLSGPIKNCLETEIPAVSAKGYELSLSFHRYISPLEQLNELMRSIREDKTQE